MTNRDALFDSQGVVTGAKWDVAVAINRNNALPLDASSIFRSYEEAVAYATTGVTAYPGQIISVINADGTNEYYGIAQDGSLEEIGGAVDVDGLSIMLDGEKLSIKGYGKQYYKYVNVDEPVSEVSQLNADAAEGTYCKVGETWYLKGAEGWATTTTHPADGDHYILTEGFVAGLQPKVELNSDGKLQIAWFEPSATTVEGLGDQIASVTATVNTMQGTVSSDHQTLTEISPKVAANETAITGIDSRVKTAFVDAAIDKTAGKATFTKDGGATKDIAFTGFAHGAIYDSDTLTLTIPVYGSDDVVVNIPKDKFLRDGRYEAEYDFGDGVKGPALVFVVDDEDADTDNATKEIAVPADALVSDYTGTTTTSAKVSISAGHVISVDVNLPAITAGHLVQVDSTGALVDAGKTIEEIATAINEAKSELEAKITNINNAINSINATIAKLTIGEGSENEVITSTADGIKRSGKTVGGATIANEPNADTLATEAAVAAIMSWGHM